VTARPVVDDAAFVGWGGVVDDDIARAFREGSLYFVDLVAQVPRDRYGEAGLGEWSVLELIAHTNRSHTLLVDYFERPVEPAGDDHNTPQAITARARASVAGLGDDPPAAVAAAARRAWDFVAGADADTELGTPFGPRRLADYLPVRVAELVIHGLDLARAADIEVAPPENALHFTLHHIADAAERRGAATAVVLALSGRSGLPEGFSVY
jgi:uncharacterized protein (TIGR03083 family)